MSHQGLQTTFDDLYSATYRILDDAKTDHDLVKQYKGRPPSTSKQPDPPLPPGPCYPPGFMYRLRKAMIPSIARSWIWSGMVEPSAASGKT